MSSDLWTIAVMPVTLLFGLIGGIALERRNTAWLREELKKVREIVNDAEVCAILDEKAERAQRVLRAEMAEEMRRQLDEQVRRTEF